MNLLGIDTSTATTAAVLRADGEAFGGPAKLAEPGPHRGHAAELLPAVAERLKEAGLGFEQIDAIAVGVGPGGFTGLRIGLATAIGLARAHGAELRPVSSLAALAAAAAGEGSLRLPLIDARRGELFGALYEDGIQRWEPFAAAPAALVGRLRHELGDDVRRLIAAGDGSLRFRDELESAGLRIAPPSSTSHSVSALAVCGLAATVEPVSPEALIPLYVREPDAIATT